MITEEFVLNLDDYALRCLINSPLSRLIAQGENRYIDTMMNYISSWYKPDPSFKIEYFSHDSIGYGFDLVIASSEEMLSLNDMLDYILKNNGFALSKDNLFMLTEVPAFQQYLSTKLAQLHVKNGDKRVNMTLVAPAHKDNLILSQYLFYPCIELSDEVSDNYHLIQFTRHREDQKVNRFAYFKKK